MAVRDDLHRLMDELPDGDLPLLTRFLRGLLATRGFPDLGQLLLGAPKDDEAWTAADELAFRAGNADVSAGQVVGLDKLRKAVGA
jgi:hypothetical protein